MLKELHDYMVALDKLCDEKGITKEEFTLYFPKKLGEAIIEKHFTTSRKLTTRHEGRGFVGFAYHFAGRTYPIEYITKED